MLVDVNLYVNVAERNLVAAFRKDSNLDMPNLQGATWHTPCA